MQQLWFTIAETFESEKVVIDNYQIIIERDFHARIEIRKVKDDYS